MAGKERGKEGERDIVREREGRREGEVVKERDLSPPLSKQIRFDSCVD